MSAELQPRLVAYQRRWLADRSTRRACVKSRRCGMTEAAAIEAAGAAVGVDLATGETIKPRDQLLVSASQKHSRILLDRVKHAVRAFEAVAGELFDGEPQVETLKLRSGATVYALPANPAALRGLQGDLLLDEAGAMPNAEAVWAAGIACTQPSLGAPDGFRVSVIGTPLGDQGLFHRVCRGNLASTFNVHEVTIHDAVRDGFPLRDSIESLREEVGDDDVFSQEFEAVFVSSNSRYISEALYDSCLHEGALPPNMALAGSGMDVARQGRHKTASVSLLRAPDGSLFVRDVRTERKMPWDEQETWAGQLAAQSTALAVDSSGLGSQFSERLAAQHGSKVLPVTFTTASKTEIFSGLRLAFERRCLRVRADDLDLRRAVLSLRRRTSAAGRVIFDLDESAHGHGDEAVALALAVFASGGATSNHQPLTHNPVHNVRRDPNSIAAFTRPRRGGLFAVPARSRLDNYPRFRK